MYDSILAQRNILWKIKELMQDAGFTTGNYNVITSYPTDQEKTTFSVPIIAVQILAGANYDYQISSEPNQLRVCVCDVFAIVPGQLDAILDILIKNFHKEADFEFYNMSNTEPSVIGDYTGLSSLGIMQIESPFYRKMDVPENVADKRFLYEGFFTMNVKLPYIP